jgi:hypothetical protein
MLEEPNRMMVTAMCAVCGKQQEFELVRMIGGPIKPQELPELEASLVNLAESGDGWRNIREPAITLCPKCRRVKDADRKD